MPHFLHDAKRLKGPILVIGAGGFVGANLFKTLLSARRDVLATTTGRPAWRLGDVPKSRLIPVDLLRESSDDVLLKRSKAKTIFNCSAYGAYSWQTEEKRIYSVNFEFVRRFLSKAASRLAFFVQAGSSSEYGDHAAAPGETAAPTPNSHYAVSKAACAALLYYLGSKAKLPCAHLRLYSVYGPLEDASRLIPSLISHGCDGKLPALVSPDISRDFLYVDDAVSAFVSAALRLKPENYGEAFNIGSGVKTTIRAAAAAAAKLFGLKTKPAFGAMRDRRWDVQDWYCDPRKARRELGWKASVRFEEGLRLTAAWYRSLPDPGAYLRATEFKKSA